MVECARLGKVTLVLSGRIFGLILNQSIKLYKTNIMIRDEKARKNPKMTRMDGYMKDAIQEYADKYHRDKNGKGIFDKALRALIRKGLESIEV